MIKFINSYLKGITTAWAVALTFACLVGFTFAHLLWRIIGSEAEAFIRYFGEFVGFRPTFHVTITLGDAVALKYGFWIIFVPAFLNYLMRWAVEEIASVREFAKKMYKWGTKPLLFCLIFGVLFPYAIDLLFGIFRWGVFFCTGKMSDSWRVLGPFVEHKFHFTFDGTWETFWLWLDGPTSAATQHFSDELRRQL